MKRPIALFLAGAVAVGVALCARPNRAQADDEATAKNERCATRLSIAILGKSASPELLASSNPQSAVDSLLMETQFIERFARFVNAKFNAEPGETLADDAPYSLAKFVLGDGKTPWKEMFVGKYNVGEAVTKDDTGLGYFRSEAWMKRYAGNEGEGLRIVAAYRMMQNTMGLQLIATTNAEGADISANGRKGDGCKSCHYEGPFALDFAARILSKRNLKEDAKKPYLDPTEGPQPLLDKTINADQDFVETLVASEDFNINSCRLAFEFLYGRTESTCEGPAFDKCVAAFKQSATMHTALSTLAKEPGYCQ